MKNWIKRNLKSIIVTAFVIPILLVAFVSISHVTSFYGISNPFAWAVYLSVAVEIAALSALAGVSVKLGKFIYFPFLLVTLIQFVGNLFFSYSYIQELSETFKQWMEMAGPLFEPMGIETTDIPMHKLILALFSGGLLPIISLTFAHMLVVYSNKEEQVVTPTPVIDLEEVSRQAGIIERENQKSEIIDMPQEKIDLLEKHINQLQNQKFGKTEQLVSDSEPIEIKIEEEVVKPQEEIIIDNQTVEELKDKLAEDSSIKRLTYTKRNA
jgi:hypothetical protein